MPIWITPLATSGRPQVNSHNLTRGPVATRRCARLRPRPTDAYWPRIPTVLSWVKRSDSRSM
ncbi:hypothetical protein PGTUg99_019649 [Puccinia graminis f. sp. tritici]|uniref:Uncharacterized protein n=1 Tax=Puccinia graminis f. sp. tritici TaxID=56615 RepID=A0A5B0LVS5_PUCGR|nr:hypothetical protein PGTUg99_019649 [Puccinia graminis f. sp. tritici]